MNDHRRNDLLPSWREGPTRQALIEFLDAAGDIAPENRLAVFDNDGTLWCEKPRYPQIDFFVWELRQAVQERPELGDVSEFSALLAGDQAALADFGLERVALALLGLFEGIEPERFADRVRKFFAETSHPGLGRRYDNLVYEPMLELLDALEQRGFVNCIITGGGTEFLRAVSRRIYGVPPERVVGTLVTYDFERRQGRPRLVRRAEVQGGVNEGPTKVANIQVALGCRPVLAAGNSPGDAEMLEYAASGDGPGLALVVNHDDADREYAYEGKAGSYDAEESIEATAARLGLTQVSMRNDWTTVFPDP
jgi:phosphoserine phosphatase